MSQAGYDSKWPLTIDIDIVLNLSKKEKKRTSILKKLVSLFHLFHSFTRALQYFPRTIL